MKNPIIAGIIGAVLGHYVLSMPSPSAPTVVVQAPQPPAQGNQQYQQVARIDGTTVIPGAGNIESAPGYGQVESSSDAQEAAIPTTLQNGYSIDRSSSTLIGPRPEIAGDVEASVKNLDAAMREAPVAFEKMARSIEKNGLAALAYTDPEVKSSTDKLGNFIGVGLRHMAEAIKNDMIAVARESGVGAHHQQK